MRGAVDAGRETAHHGDARLGQPRRQLVGDPPTVLAGPPGADDGHRR